MGAPAFAESAHLAGWEAPFGDLLCDLPETAARRITGKGLHMPSVAAALLWAMVVIRSGDKIDKYPGRDKN
eukprot:11541741-Prorocentrum_lima.AAC.1